MRTHILIVIGTLYHSQCSVEIDCFILFVYPVWRLKNRAAIQVNIVGRDGSVGPPVFLISPQNVNVTSQCPGYKEVGSSVSLPIQVSMRLKSNCSRQGITELVRIMYLICRLR